MAKIKFSPDLFLESQELTRFKEFLDDDGWRLALLKNSISFGIVDNSVDGAFTNFRVEQGTNAGTYKVSEGFAIDSNGEFIRKVAQDNIAIPDDDTWYYIKISHGYINTEVGLVDIDTSGNVTGTNTFFTEVLRGQPNIPSRVKFANASLNTGEYDVLEVIDDENTILAGTGFSAETDLTLVVVGSFTSDAVPSAGEKDIFQYDATTIALETSSTVTAGTQFIIARVKNNGGTVSIEDRRTDIYRTKADFILTDIDEVANPLVGVEAVKFNHPFSTRAKNQVLLAWNFRSSNWTYQTELNQVTLNAGVGGKFKTTTDFTNGDFDGWRLYTEDGKYSIVKTSTKSGSQINLILASLDPDLFSANPSQELVVAPDVEEIEVHCNPDPGDSTDLPIQIFAFPIKLAFARMPLLAYKNPSCSYNIAYRYKNNGRYTILTPIPTDTASGYLAESSFDSQGTQIASNRQTYTSHATNGFITISLSPNAYSQFAAQTDSDVKQIDVITLDNGSPVKTLTAGISDRYQRVQGTITLSVNHYINLSSVDAIDGSTFFLKLEADITLNGFTIQIVQDYVNPGSPGTLITDIDTFLITEGQNGNGYVLLRYDFDGTNWIPWEGVAFRNQAVSPTGPAGGDLSGNFPNPNVDTVSGLTASRALQSDGSGDLIVSATVTSTELGYLNGVTSDIQTQFSGKQATITGGATTITSSNLTASRALVSDGSGKVAASATITATELDYLNGVTSGIQSQINSKEDTITGAATTITGSNLTASRALISNGSGKVAVHSTVSDTELGYLNGVTSGIQGQIDAKQATITGAATTITSSDLTASRALISNGSGKVAVSTVTSTELSDVVAAVSGLNFVAVDIGDWDMDATSGVLVSISSYISDPEDIRGVDVLIRDDAGNIVDPLNKFASGSVQGSWSASGTNISLSRTASGIFDTTDYDQTSFNRGWVLLTYI